jgi:cadmium resistance protein CadD (predicted permease)
MSFGTIFGGIITAFFTFTVTNIDDFGIILIYFARAKSNQNMTKGNVYLGQFIGFTIICLISMLGMVLGLFISQKYLSLLGLVPLFIGLKNLFKLFKQKTDDDDVDEKHFEHDYKLVKNEDTTGEENIKEESLLTNLSSNFLKSILNSQALEVALVTIANGGDNISIYMPLFSTSSWEMLIITFVVFYLLLFIFLILTSNIVGIKIVAELLEKYEKYLIPIVFIGLGFYILSDSVMFDFMG